MTATTTEMSSTFPPLNTFPCSLARLANGTSSSNAGAADTTAPESQLNLELELGLGVLRGLRSDTRRAREQSASESMPASVRRPIKLLVGGGDGDGVFFALL